MNDKELKNKNLKDQDKKKVKSNNPSSKYIPVFNNKDLFLVEKLLNKDKFEIDTENNTAMASLTEKNSTIIAQLLNPIEIIQQAGIDIIPRDARYMLELMEENTREVYKILTANWLLRKMKDGEREGKSYCTFEEIHFDYRGLTGKNKTSTLNSEQYNQYIHAIDFLRNCSVTIDISNSTSTEHLKAKQYGIGAIECYLINQVEWAYNEDKTKIIGFWYDLGSIGEIYTSYIKPQINEKYPTELLQLSNSQYKSAKEIGNYLCYLYKLEDKESTQVSFLDLIIESNYTIVKSYAKRCIERFFVQFNKAAKLLIDNDILVDYKIPQEITSKNYINPEISIILFWKKNSKKNNSSSVSQLKINNI